MNLFVEVEYDSFEKKKVVKTKKLIPTSIIDDTLGLQTIGVAFASVQVKEEIPNIALGIGHSSLNIGQVTVLIKLNDDELLSFDAFDNDDMHSAIQISIEELEKLCDAQTIEVRIKNANGHTDFTSSELQFGARVMYNAVIDENSYLEEIQEREEQEIAKLKKHEEEEKAQKAKLSKRHERLIAGKVNKYVTTKYDKFKQRLDVCLKDDVELDADNSYLIILHPKVDFRYIYVAGKNPALLLDITAISESGLNLKDGQLIFVLDNNKRISLDANESYSKPYLESFHIESDWYDITEEDLKAICDANVIELQITNGADYSILSTDGLKMAACRFYNAVIDETAYLNEMCTPAERKAAERERIRKEQAAKAAEEARKRAEQAAENARVRAEKRKAWWQKNWKKVLIACSVIVLLLITAFIFYKIEEQKHYKQAQAAAQTEAQAYIASGDSCVAIAEYNKAREFYDKAYGLTEDVDIRDTIHDRIIELDKIAPFIPVDIKWARAYGRIKTITQSTPENGNYYEDQKVYKFDKNGVLLSVNRGEYKIRRDAQGRISEIYREIDTEWGTEKLGCSYNYDNKGFVVTESGGGLEWSDEIHYTNDKKGWCISAIAQAQGDCDDTPRNYTFSYSDIDSCGNWQKQITKVVWQRPNGSSVEEFITTRTITYWENVEAVTSASTLENTSPPKGNAEQLKQEVEQRKQEEQVSHKRAEQKHQTKQGVLRIPDGTKKINPRKYKDRKDITSVIIPNSVTSIGDYAFYGCTGLTSIEIPNSVTSIGNCAFKGCTGLTSLTIPDHVQKIGTGAFSGCCSLESIKISSNNQNYCSVDGVLYNKDKTELIVFPAGKCGAFAIPNSVKKLQRESFVGCSKLISVTIGDNVTSIGSGAFQYCTGLTSITIPNSVTRIQMGTFIHCTGLTSIILPNSLETIESVAFRDCTGLTSVYIPDNVTFVGRFAFGGCTNLTSISIGNHISYGGDWCFDDSKIAIVKR